MRYRHIIYWALSLVVIALATIVSLAIYAPSSYYLLAFVGQLPALIILMFIYYPAVALLTPNPRTSALVGLVAMEVLEHLVMPAVLLVTIFTVPFLFYPILGMLILLTYGVLLGSVKQVKDVFKLAGLYLVIALGMWVPELLLYVAHTYNFSFTLAAVVLCAAASTIYLYFKRTALVTMLAKRKISGG